jgi:secondary thiamine-phosphate synthase enzyme
MILQRIVEINSAGRGTSDISAEIERVVTDSGVTTGICHVFTHHTSASLRRDLERFMSRIVPDGDLSFEHDAEGPDDMPAHIRAVLTTTGLSVPISAGRLALGTWQGVYLWEHRHRPHRRQITITVMGET